MKKYIMYCLIFLLFGAPCFGRDFIVEFVEENYRETQSSFSYRPIIYHSIQVSSQAGPKLLVLKGEDDHYRNWLRQFIATEKAFVVKIPDDRADLFITSSAFEIDVTDVHPMNMTKYRQGEQKYKTDPGRLDPQAIYGSSGKKKSDLKDKQDQEMSRREKLKKDRMQKDKTKTDQAEQKAEALAKKTEKQRLEKQKEQSQKLAAEELRKKQALEKELEKALEKEKQEQKKLMAKIAEQKALEDAQRQKDLEQRWLELKRRLLEDEKIKGLERQERERELNRRWLELRQQLGIQ